MRSWLLRSVWRCCRIQPHQQQQLSLLAPDAAAAASANSSSSSCVPALACAGRSAFATAAGAPQASDSTPAAPPAPPRPQQQRQKQPAASSAASTAAPQPSFEQLREQYQAQLSIRNSQGEAKLLALVRQASTTEQVQQALDLVLWDKMVRARLRQVSHLSTHVTAALLKAGIRAELGPRFAVTLLQRADELGLQVSNVVCQSVLETCNRQQDYWAAAEAWVYTQVFCADPSRQPGGCWSSTVSGSAQGHQQQPPPQQQQQQREGPLAWANNGLLKAYAWSLAGCLQAAGGCVSQEHEAHVRQQLQQLVAELEARDGAVPAPAREVLAGGGSGGSGGGQQEQPKEEAKEEEADK